MRNPNERGSALVLVMFVALLLTILGLAVLGATMGGAQRTETRENDVQSLHLAQKGLDEAVAYIQTKLDGRKDIDPDHMEDEIKNIVNEVSTKIVGVSNDVTELSGAGFTIKSITYEKQDKQKYYVDIEAQATVNGVKRQLKQKIVIDTYPDFLKYAFGSEGVLTLNGAPGFHGNIYAGEKLVISDVAKYKYKGPGLLTKQTQYPRVGLFSGGGSIVGVTEKVSEVHVQSLQTIEYSGFVGSGVVSSNNATTILPKILGVAKEQVLIKPYKKFIQINVLESFIDKVTEAIGTGNRDRVKDAVDKNELGDYLKNKMTNLPDSNLPNKPVLPDKPTEAEEDDYNLKYSQYLDNLKNYKIRQNLLLKDRTTSAIYYGDLLIDGIDKQQLTFTAGSKSGNDIDKPKWIIVKGNLEINNYSSDQNNFYPYKQILLSLEASLLREEWLSTPLCMF